MYISVAVLTKNGTKEELIEKLKVFDMNNSEQLEFIDVTDTYLHEYENGYATCTMTENNRPIPVQDENDIDGETISCKFNEIFPTFDDFMTTYYGFSDNDKENDRYGVWDYNSHGTFDNCTIDIEKNKSVKMLNDKTGNETANLVNEIDFSNIINDPHTNTEQIPSAIIDDDGIWYDSDMFNWRNTDVTDDRFTPLSKNNFELADASLDNRDAFVEKYYKNFIEPAIEQNLYITYLHCHR